MKPATRPSSLWLAALVLGLTLGLALVAPARAQMQAPERPLLMIETGTHSAPVRRIDVHAERGIAVTASDDRTARVWGLAGGELRHVLRPPASGAQLGRLYGVAIHPREPLVAVAGTTSEHCCAQHWIYLFDVDSGALVRTIDAKAGDVRKLAWSPDGSVLFAGYNGTHGVRAFALDGRELLDDRFGGPVFGLAVGPGGLAAAVSLDGQLRSYRIAGGAVSRAGAVALGGNRRPAGVAFSPDGRQLAVAYATGGEGPELFDPATLQTSGKLPAPPVFGGDFRVLAWSADGRTLAVGGTAYSRELRFPVVAIDVAARRVGASTDVAGDSVTDLVALPAAAGGGFAYASFDGSWGRVAADGSARSIGAAVNAVRGNAPQDLELSSDALAVRWAARNPGGGLGFAFDRRRLANSPRDMGVPQRAPEIRFGPFDTPSNWLSDTRPPVVGGRPMQLAADERGRAIVIARTQPVAAAIVGTNRALYRVDERGAVAWRVPVDTEVRAVNASADGRLLVSAMADGTLRWWRTSDGALLLTLLAQADGRWVVWTPNGYFDAGVGADRIAGWALPQGPAQAMSFFSLNRFREQFNRPDVIDAVLKTLDEKQAFALIAAEQEAARVAAQRDAERQAAAARDAERLAAERAEQARQAMRAEAERRAAAERAEREAAAARAEAERVARLEAERQRRETERARLEAERLQREAAARADAERRAAAAREAALAAALAAARADAEREAARAKAREEARLAAEAAQRERAAREAEAQRLAAEAQRLAAAARAEAERLAEQARQAAQLAAERERAERAAAAEAERVARQREAERQQALREAAERERAATEAKREAEQRAQYELARKALVELKAIEFPPALQGVSQRTVKTSARSVTLPFALSSPAAAGEVSIEVRLAGRPAQPAEVVMPRSLNGQAQGHAKVELSFDPSAGDSTVVEIIARNKYGLSEPLVFTIERDAPPRPPGASPGDLYVLAVGVAEYARAEYKLGLAAKDARDFAAAMARQDGKQFRRVIVRTLTDAQATRAAVVRELEWLRTSVGSTDTAMLFMAGHGVNDSAGQYFFIPHDGQHERLLTTAVPQATIVSTLAQIKGRTLVFIDTCFAGNALGALHRAPKKTERLINDLSASENGVVVFASSTGQEESLERDSWGNGAFTKALLEGLSGRADFMRAGRITYAALNLYVSEEVTRLTEGKQRPVFISPRGVPDFAVARL
jgi:WD40 repeat protein